MPPVVPLAEMLGEPVRKPKLFTAVCEVAVRVPSALTVNSKALPP
jgi:hypothetical protein